MQYHLGSEGGGRVSTGAVLGTVTKAMGKKFNDGMRLMMGEENGGWIFDGWSIGF